MLPCQRVKKDVHFRPQQQGCLLQFSLVFPQVPSQPRPRGQPRISLENRTTAACSPIRKPNHCARNMRRMREIWWVTGSGRGQCMPNPVLHSGSPDLPLPSFSFCPAACSNDCSSLGRASAIKSRIYPRGSGLRAVLKRVRPAVHAAVLAADSLRHSPGRSPSKAPQPALYFPLCIQGITLTNKQRLSDSREGHGAPRTTGDSGG